VIYRYPKLVVPAGFYVVLAKAPEKVAVRARRGGVSTPKELMVVQHVISIQYAEIHQDEPLIDTQEALVVELFCQLGVSIQHNA
jgi:hypothetical protein